MSARPAEVPNMLAAKVATAWAEECLERERREYALVLAAACVIFPVYGVLDVVLEPALRGTLLAGRAAGLVVLGVAALAVRRVRALSVIRMWYALGVCASAGVVAAMLGVVAHFGVYLVGYSTFFWGASLLSWPPALAGATFGCQLAAVALALALGAEQRNLSDHLSAALFLPSAALLTALSNYARREAHRRESAAAVELTERNADLGTALERLRDAQARLVAQEKLSALGRMLAGLSHEMNNPINVLKNNIEPVREHFAVLLARLERLRADGDPRLAAAWEEDDIAGRATDVVEALDGMQEASRRVCQVHADLRAFIRGDAPHITSTALEPGLRATAALVSRRLPEGIRVDVVVDPLPAVRCQPGQLNQVWLNLLRNALDAVGASGRIELRARLVGGHVEVAVSDDGPGVPDAFRARLFEPFATTKEVGSGTGLGLATSYQIVERHGGKLYLDPNHAPGARFVVELPVDETKPSHAPAAVPACFSREHAAEPLSDASQHAVEVELR